MRDDLLMQRAIDAAYNGFTTTFPNPSVGAVIVQDGVVTATGYHRKAGGPHAEIEALNQIEHKAEGATIYVTLEPCNHHGKTPPCTEAIIKSGIKKVVISVVDPNPIVNGSGIDQLRDAGIEVITGVLKDEGEELLRYFTHQIKHQTPYVTLKGAVSLNGMLNEAGGVRSMITGSDAYHYTQKLRAQHQAVLVGINTVRIDNPTFKGSHKIIVGDGSLSQELNIFHSGDSITQIVTEIPDHKNSHINYLMIPETITVQKILKKLYHQKIGSLFVEGGSSILTQFFESGCYNRVHIYYAPKLFGAGGLPLYGGDQSMTQELTISETKVLGDDLMIRMEHVYRGN